MICCGVSPTFSATQLVHLPARVVHLRGADERGAGPAVFDGEELSGKAVLLDTGWDEHARTDATAAPPPFLTADGARALIDAGVVLVGTDSVNIDDTSAEAAGERPAHTVLLTAGVPVVEHLRDLDQLAEHGRPVQGRRLRHFPGARLRRDR